MLNLIISIVGILFIVFLIRFYKEYEMKDKVPLLFLEVIMLMAYFMMAGVLVQLKRGYFLQNMTLFLALFLIAVPAAYFFLLKYFVNNRLFVYFRKQTQIYLKSFKHLDKKFFYNTLLSIGLFIAFLLILFVFGLFLRNSFSPLLGALSPMLNDQGEISPEVNQQAVMALYQNADLLKSVITKSIVYLVIALIVLLFVASILKGIMWSNILKQKYDKLFFRRFTGLSLIWYFLCMVLIAVVLVVFKLKAGAAIAAALIFLCLYLKMVLHLNFDKNKTIVQNFKNVKKGFTRFYLMVIPFMFIYISFLLVSMLGMVLLVFDNRIYLILIAAMLAGVLVSFINWARFYLVEVKSSETQQ